jgi:hypothetical protein
MTTRRMLLALTLGLCAALPAAAQDLNLAQRRAVEAYKADPLPAFQARIDAAAGKPVPVTVDWPKIALPDMADRYLEPDFWTNIYFEPLAQALESVGRDEMGKTALGAGLTAITVTYDEATAPASAYENGLAFEGGTLTLNFTPFSNAGDIAPRAAAIQALLESKL